MFKFLLLIALCMLVAVECMPSEEPRLRVARQTNPMEAGMNVASQMAAAAAEAAKKAIDMGKQVMQGMAQGAAAGTAMIPGMGGQG